VTSKRRQTAPLFFDPRVGRAEWATGGRRRVRLLRVGEKGSAVRSLASLEFVFVAAVVLVRISASPFRDGSLQTLARSAG
jgi:hypothetical protein